MLDNALAPKNMLYWLLALIAFAANSILCRYGLYDSWIDPTSFTILRLFSGAIVLGICIFLSQKSFKISNYQPSKKHFWGASFLLLYAVGFSFAYISLDTATGALILFSSVQLSMIGIALFKGDRLNKKEWLGLITAFAGFLYLTLPKFNTPSLQGLILMAIAGIGWGLYTINGKGSKNPLLDTGLNFTIAAIGSLFLLWLPHTTAISLPGALTALASGALASGLGYALWYSVLPVISTTQAASSQLSVPVIAGIGGFIFLGEAITISLVIASILILSGIYWVVNGKK